MKDAPSKAPRTWYEVVEATTATLPWRVEAGGIKVLGDDFEGASPTLIEKREHDAKPLPDWRALASPVLPAEPETPEQAYGRAVHQLLQGLPLPPHHPAAATAEADVARLRSALPWLWATGSRAEVALVLPNGQIGRADRLVPHEDAWWVIDFKTGIPQTPVPANYAAQLAGYAQALQASMPKAVVKTAIVWVATATLAETAWNR